jgi:hypothetical protein
VAQHTVFKERETKRREQGKKKTLNLNRSESGKDCEMWQEQLISEIVLDVVTGMKRKFSEGQTARAQ